MFSAADLIHTYSRAEAIEDGTLVDAGDLAREAGFRFPVAMTRAAFEDLVAWDDTNLGIQDEAGRLWDVLWMARLAAKSATGGDRAACSVLRVPNTPRATKPRLARFVMVVGPGDDLEPVVTIQLHGED